MKKIAKLLFFFLLFAMQGIAQTNATKDNCSPAPVKLTADQDHTRLMNLLNITALRPGPSGNATAPNHANSDESKATTYTSLPDPLILKNGKKVTTAAIWNNQRRAEIFEDFDREVYGRQPKNTPKVTWEVLSQKNDTVGSIPVIVKKLIGRTDNSSYPCVKAEIQLTLTVPANVKDPVPVILEFGFDFSAFARPATAQTTQAARPVKFVNEGLKQVIEKGWGFAVIVPTSYQADNGAGLTDGIIGLVNKGQPRKVDDWGTLRAWAWGASRALDYFETDKSVNAKQVGIEGLSRYGKAAIVTLAYDQRFAIGFIASSGEGGVKLHRRTFGEQVESLANTGEYHWMSGNFLKYAGPLTPNDLPVDSHELVALCAPRPVFISFGVVEKEGSWLDNKGMFLGGVYAEPVYRLLGKKGMGTSEMPPAETALIDGEIGFRQHNGGHTAGPNWPTFITFASKYFK